MPTTCIAKICTFILLIALCASCFPNGTMNQPFSPPTLQSPLPTQQVSTKTSIAPAAIVEPTLTSEPTQPPAATQKPPRGAKTPVGAGQGQGQGSAASQNLIFNIPTHSLDVILGRPTTNSVVLSLLSYEMQTLTISYGTSPGNYTSQTEPVNLKTNVPQVVQLTNLQPDTLYYYSIKGIENTFHTARVPGSTYTFSLQADSHLDSNSNSQVYLQTLANEKADRPDFVIDLGDTFMTEKYSPYTAAAGQYLAQRYYFSQVAQTAPLFLTLGNHDGEGASRGNSGNEMPDWAARMRTTYFPNPVPDSFYTGNTALDEKIGDLQDYYAWQWGDALFIVLDPYHFSASSKSDSNDLWNRTLGIDQYRWLKTTLETSTAKWKFIFIHQLISGTDQNGRGGVEVAGFYEWGGKNADGTWGFADHRPGWDMPIHQLLMANDVTAVFHGHDHLFAEQELDGIIYQGVPQSSAARANNTSSTAQYGYVTGNILGSSGHLRVTITPDEIKVEYVRAYLPKDEKFGQHNRQGDFTYTIGR